ncbi:MAG: hypothetical protein ABF379_14695 [Akkermansiaceae bacterium]
MRVLLLFILALFGVDMRLSAEMVFEKKTIEVHVKPGQNLAMGLFPFEIVGEGETIVKADVFCTCLTPQIPLGPDRTAKLDWKVGEKGVIKGRFETKQFLGTVEKAIEITLAGGNKVTLNFRVIIPELIKLEPATLKWNKGEAADERVVKITVDHDKPIKIVSDMGNNDKVFPYTLKTIKEGWEYELRIKPTSTETSGMGMISLRTDSTFPRFKRKVLYAVVRPKTVRNPVKIK